MILQILSCCSFINDKWKISSANVPDYDKCQISRTAIIKNCILGDNCEIEGCIDTSVLSKGVKVGEGSVIENSVILENTIIEPHVIISNAIIGGDSIIKEGSVIVERESITVVGPKRMVSQNTELEKIEIEKIKDIKNKEIENKILV